MWLGESKVFVLPVAGGSPKQVGVDIPWCAWPVWSPDGKTLLVAGMAGVGDLKSMELWSAPLAGGKSTRLAVFKLLRENRLPISSYLAGEWCGESLLRAAGSEVWALDSPADPSKKGHLRKLVTGTARLAHVRGTLSRFVFSSFTIANHLWTLPLDENSGKPRGLLQPLPHMGGSQVQPASSANGRVLAYRQVNPAGSELRLRDMRSGRESVLIARYARPRVSPDGSKVAYSVYPLGSLFLMESSGGQPEQLLDSNAQATIFRWTADGNHLVYYLINPIRWYLYDLRSRRSHEFLSHPKLDIHGAEPSPDLKWVSFHLAGPLNVPIKVAPMREGRAAGEAEWFTVAEYPGLNERLFWSPDGSVLYFNSQRDNYHCIWAQRLNPATKHPVGEPFAVYHFHESRRAINTTDGWFGPAIAKDHIIFSLMERTGNMWLAELEK